MKVIEYASKNLKLGGWVKTGVSNILKTAKNLQKEYEFFKCSFEKMRYGQ